MSYDEKQVEFFRSHLKTNGGIEVFIKHLLQCGQQNIHTPFDLCREIVGKLNEYTPLDGKSVAVLFNVEFLHVFINNYGVRPKNITIFVEDKREFEFCKLEYNMTPDVNLFFIDMEKTTEEEGLHTLKGKIMKKFDVVVGNPPYQSTSGNKGKGNILWDKFVAKADEQLVNDGGFICLVHPSLWRKPNHELQKHFMQNDLRYLEIHDEKDGQKTFGANTRYDWYVLRKGASTGKTAIKGQDGKLVEIDLRKWEFIPNFDFQLVKKLLAENPKDRVEILHSESAYESRKEWMSVEKTTSHKHPVVYMVKMDNTPITRWSSRTDRGHYGVPKVIFGLASSQGAFVDETGAYGMTQWAGAIVDTPKNLPKIAQALTSDAFRNFCLAISLRHEVNVKALRFFRKDFWKEFA